MQQHRRLSIWTLIANFFIVIAAGHGIGVLGFLEFVIMGSLIGISDAFSYDDLFQSKLCYASVVNLVGQLLIITAFFVKPNFLLALKLSGLISLMLAFGILLSFLWQERTNIVTLVTGIPFVVLSIVLTYRLIKPNGVIGLLVETNSFDLVPESSNTL